MTYFGRKSALNDGEWFECDLCGADQQAAFWHNESKPPPGWKRLRSRSTGKLKGHACPDCVSES